MKLHFSLCSEQGLAADVSEGRSVEQPGVFVPTPVGDETASVPGKGPRHAHMFHTCRGQVSAL